MHHPTTIVVLLASSMLVAQAKASDDAITANFWIDACQDNSPGMMLCRGYLRGITDMNDMSTFASKQAWWCLPDGVTLDQIRKVILAELARRPEDHHHPFAGLATMALRNAFPCKKKER